LTNFLLRFNFSVTGED